MNNPPTVCSVEPFLYPATPQAGGGDEGEESAYAAQANDRAVEDYLSRLKDALCDDIQSIVDEVVALTTRIEILEGTSP